MKHYSRAIGTLICAALSACNNPAAMNAPSFNLSAMSGEMTLQPGNPAIALKGYELTGADGEVMTFETCAAVMALTEAQTIPSEYFFYRRYTLDCYAAQKFMAADNPPRKTFFPYALFDALPEMPAGLSPQIGDAGLYEARKTQTLADIWGTARPQKNLEAELNKSVTIVFDGAEIDYVIIARCDLNTDGIEDLIIRMTYHSIEGSGKASYLYAVTKTSEERAVEILWEYG